MSTDGGSAGEAARGLADRIRALASDGRARSQAMRQSRRERQAESQAAESGTTAPDSTGPARAPLAGHATNSGRNLGTGDSGHRGDDGDSGSRSVPNLLRSAAAWSWRLLLVGAVAYFAFKAAVALRLLVLPLIAALLLSALLQPLTARLRRLGLPATAATWCTLLAAIVVLAGLGTLIANRVQADYPVLAAEVQRTVNSVQHYLSGPPFRLSGIRLHQLSGRLLTYLAQHKTLVLGTVLTGGRYFLEVLAGLILTVFITFFFLKDGHRIWRWLISGLRPVGRHRADQAGEAAWEALVGYIRGTTAVAAIHAVFIGLALWLLGVPLLVPLVILVFLAAYVPLIGILVVGALAILVTLATDGWVAAVILIAVFLAENQIESHLLQPLVVGRIVRLHPLAIIIVLAVGGIVAGIPGAIVAVPTAAVISHAWPYLRGDHDHERLSDGRRD